MSLILRPEQIALLRAGQPIVPANFGGDSSSSSSNTTTTHTTNVDRRLVVDGGAIGLTVDGGAVTVNHTSQAAWDLAHDALFRAADAYARADYTALSGILAGQGLANAAMERSDALARESLFRSSEAYARADQSTMTALLGALGFATDANRSALASGAQSSRDAIGAVERTSADAMYRLSDAYARADQSTMTALLGALGFATDANRQAAATTNRASVDALAVSNRAFDLAASSSQLVDSTIGKALGFVEDTLNFASETGKLAQASAANVGDAYKLAQDSATGQRYLVAAGFVIAAIVLVAQLPNLRNG